MPQGRRGGAAAPICRLATTASARAVVAQGLLEQHRALLSAVEESAMFSGFCYTRFADTCQESNGLLTVQCEPKAPPEQVRAATRNHQG